MIKVTKVHEEGSWHVDGHNMASVIRKTADGWETVSRCPNENASWREDARLMAAAPDMLAALKTIGGFISRNMRKNNDEEWSAYSRIIAAIAKAEGRS